MLAHNKDGLGYVPFTQQIWMWAKGFLERMVVQSPSGHNKMIGHLFGQDSLDSTRFGVIEHQLSGLQVCFHLGSWSGEGMRLMVKRKPPVIRVLENSLLAGLVDWLESSKGGIWRVCSFSYDNLASLTHVIPFTAVDGKFCVAHALSLAPRRVT